MSIPINLMPIWDALVATAIMGVLGLIGTLIYKLWSLPIYQREVLDEMTLLRMTIWEIFPDARKSVYQRLKWNEGSDEMSETLRQRAIKRL